MYDPLFLETYWYSRTTCPHTFGPLPIGIRLRWVITLKQFMGIWTTCEISINFRYRKFYFTKCTIFGAAVVWHLLRSNVWKKYKHFVILTIQVFNGSNEGREKILILITDGQPHDTEAALKEAAALKRKGVHLVTIGAGSEQWINKFKYELSRIGSKPTHNHRVKYGNLQRITQKLIHTVCNSQEREPART